MPDRFEKSENPLTPQELGQLVKEMGTSGYCSAVRAILADCNSEPENGYGNYIHCARCGDETYGRSICDECVQDIEIEWYNGLEVLKKRMGRN